MPVWGQIKVSSDTWQRECPEFAFRVPHPKIPVPNALAWFCWLTNTGCHMSKHILNFRCDILSVLYLLSLSSIPGDEHGPVLEMKEPRGKCPAHSPAHLQSGFLASLPSRKNFPAKCSPHRKERGQLPQFFSCLQFPREKVVHKTTFVNYLAPCTEGMY